MRSPGRLLHFESALGFCTGEGKDTLTRRPNVPFNFNSALWALKTLNPKCSRTESPATLVHQSTSKRSPRHEREQGAGNYQIWGTYMKKKIVHISTTIFNKCAGFQFALSRMPRLHKRHNFVPIRIQKKYLGNLMWLCKRIQASAYTFAFRTSVSFFLPVMLEASPWLWPTAQTLNAYNSSCSGGAFLNQCSVSEPGGAELFCLRWQAGAGFFFFLPLCSL